MDYDYESHELLQDAVDEGMIEEGSAANGVAKQCIDSGYESLSPAQKATYDRHVKPQLEKLVERREVDERMRGMPDFTQLAVNRHRFSRHSRAAGNTAFHTRSATSHC